MVIRIHCWPAELYGRHPRRDLEELELAESQPAETEGAWPLTSGAAQL